MSQTALYYVSMKHGVINLDKLTDKNSRKMLIIPWIAGYQNMKLNLEDILRNEGKYDLKWCNKSTLHDYNEAGLQNRS